MSDDMRAPVGKPTKGEGDKTEDEAQELDEQISDDPVVKEEGEDDLSYNPAVQAPTEAEQ